jgi:hypothetical protein
MEFFQLPYLGREDTLETAVERMRSANKRAVLVEFDPFEYRMYMNQEILEALSGRGGDLKLAEIPREGFRGENVGLLGELRDELTGALEGGGQLEELMNESLRNYQGAGLGEVASRLQEALDNEGLAYSLVTQSEDVALIVSQHEGGAIRVQTAKVVCVCSRDPTHTSDQPPGKHHGACQICDGTYNCA